MTELVDARQQVARQSRLLVRADDGDAIGMSGCKTPEMIE
jgi:hypothetical protein